MTRKQRKAQAPDDANAQAQAQALQAVIDALSPDTAPDADAQAQALAAITPSDDGPDLTRPYPAPTAAPTVPTSAAARLVTLAHAKRAPIADRRVHGATADMPANKRCALPRYHRRVDGLAHDGHDDLQAMLHKGRRDYRALLVLDNTLGKGHPSAIAKRNQYNTDMRAYRKACRDVGQVPLR